MTGCYGNSGIPAPPLFRPRVVFSRDTWHFRNPNQSDAGPRWTIDTADDLNIMPSTPRWQKSPGLRLSSFRIHEDGAQYFGQAFQDWKEIHSGTFKKSIKRKFSMPSQNNGTCPADQTRSGSDTPDGSSLKNRTNQDRPTPEEFNSVIGSLKMMTKIAVACLIIGALVH